MAPALTFTGYSKDFSQRPFGLLNHPVIFTKSFFNEISGYIYTLREYAFSEGCEYTSCVEVSVLDYDPRDAYTLEHAQALYESGYDRYSAAAEALDLGIPPLCETVVARYVFKDIEVKYSDSVVKIAKQVKGAHVSKEYSREHITTYVYSLMQREYSLVVSDNVQSVEGHALWAYGICKLGQVLVYDSQQQKFLSKLLPTGNVPDKGVIPWSIPYDANSLPSSISRLRQGFYTTSTSLNHLVFVLENT